METARRLGADLQRDGINALEERAAVELPPALHGAGVYLSYAPLALAPRYAQPIGAVDVPRAAEPRLGVDAKLVGAGQVDSVIQGACGARQLVLRAPRFPSAGGGQDQLRPRERGLAGDLRETEIPADDERGPHATRLHDRKLRPRYEDKVLPVRPHEVPQGPIEVQTFWFKTALHAAPAGAPCRKALTPCLSTGSPDLKKRVRERGVLLPYPLQEVGSKTASPC